MKDFDKIFTKMDENYHELITLITPITDSDIELFKTFCKPPVTKPINKFRLNFEDSFEYIRMYFNSGRFSGFKFYDNKNLIIFAIEKKKKLHFKVLKPFGPNSMQKLVDIIKVLSSQTKFPVQVVCLNNDQLKALKSSSELTLANIKEFNYYIYDLKILNDLHGNRWKNVRQKITAFNRNYPKTKLKIEPLNLDNCRETVHFIGSWRRELLARRGLSYANLEKNKFAAQYFANKNDFDHIWSTVYRLRGSVVAFQLLYRLGPTAAGHAIGLADTNIKGLAEATQVDIWKQVYNCGIRFINDGPSWRPGLERYKKKFNPLLIQKVYQCKVKTVDL
jgi:hypothetical protein